MMEYKLRDVKDLTKEDLLEVVKFYEEKTDELEHHLKFAFSISEIEIKLVILKFLQEYEHKDENVAGAFKDLLLSIYMYPENIFDVASVEDLIEEVEQQKDDYFEALNVRMAEEIIQS